MTTEQIKAHEEAGFQFHIPLPKDVHRRKSNCQVCDAYIKRHDDAWIEDEQ